MGKNELAPAEQVETPHKPAVTVDTSEFVILLNYWMGAEPGDDAKEYYDDLVSHIDAHVARAVAEAIKQERAENDGAVRLITDRMMKAEKALAAIQPSQPAGAIQEIIRQAKSPEEHGWQDVTEDQFIKASINGYEVRIVYLAPPAAVQSTQELRDALTELATVQKNLINANAEITALNLAASAKQPDSERDAALEEAAKLCDFQATWAEGEAEDIENSVRYRHENIERQTSAELCAASIRAAMTAAAPQTREG